GGSCCANTFRERLNRASKAPSKNTSAQSFTLGVNVDVLNWLARISTSHGSDQNSLARTASGNRLSTKPIGAQGHAGTKCSDFPASMAFTIARQPVCASTMNGVFFTFSLISVRI